MLTRLRLSLSPCWRGARDGTVGRRVRCAAGRTFLSAGLVEEARTEAHRGAGGGRAFVERGVPMSGSSRPACSPCATSSSALLPGPQTRADRSASFLLEEFIAQRGGRRVIWPADCATNRRSSLHGHCHQKAFGADGCIKQRAGAGRGAERRARQSRAAAAWLERLATARHLRRIDGHGRAWACSRAVRKAAPDTIIAADGFSCRHQGFPRRHGAAGRAPMYAAASSPPPCARGRWMPQAASPADRPLKCGLDPACAGSQIACFAMRRPRPYG